MKIKVKERHLYGRMVYYPNNKTADQMLQVLDMPTRKCFTLNQLNLIRKLGYEVEIESYNYDYKK